MPICHLEYDQTGRKVFPNSHICGIVTVTTKNFPENIPKFALRGHKYNRG